MKFNSLQEINQTMAQDPSCALLDGASRHVFGEGSCGNGIFLIGEAPGAKEDELGRPFVGRSGQILREMLRNAGFKEEECYITNIVKCRPPENRDPKPEEKAAYVKYLDAEIEILQPKVICALGRHSGGYFIPDLKISEQHGEVFEVDGRMIYPVFHPAVACYGTVKKYILQKDINKLKKVLTGEIK